MILMVVAIACGLGASYMTSRLLAERSSEPHLKLVFELSARKVVGHPRIKEVRGARNWACCRLDKEIHPLGDYCLGGGFNYPALQLTLDLEL